MLLHAEPDPSRRFTSIGEALGKAGDDGIVVFLYGPKWNRRSEVLLHKFWERDEVQQASGQALLVAQAVDAGQSSLPSPMGSYLPICPSLIFLDKQGSVYAYMPGMDAIGDETGSQGVQNIRTMIARLRQRDGYMAQSRQTQGTRSADLIHKAAEVPFPQPHYINNHFPNPEYSNSNPRVRFASLIRQADPSDSRRYARSLLYSPVSFMYGMLNTRDGFVSPRFVPNYEYIKAECLKIAKDNSLRPEDRQQAYALIIGIAHRQNQSPREIYDFITAFSQLDASSFYGRLAPTLMHSWAGTSGNGKHQRKPPRRPPRHTPHHTPRRTPRHP